MGWFHVLIRVLSLLLVFSFISEVQAFWPTFLQCECEVIPHIACEQGCLERSYIFLRLKVQFWHTSDRQEGTWRVNTKLNLWSYSENRKMVFMETYICEEWMQLCQESQIIVESI